MWSPVGILELLGADQVGIQRPLCGLAQGFRNADPWFLRISPFCRGMLCHDEYGHHASPGKGLERPDLGNWQTPSKHYLNDLWVTRHFLSFCLPPHRPSHRCQLATMREKPLGPFSRIEHRVRSQRSEVRGQNSDDGRQTTDDKNVVFLNPKWFSLCPMLTALTVLFPKVNS